MELDRSWKSPEISLSPNKDAMQSNVKAMAYKMQSCVSSMSEYLLPNHHFRTTRKRKGRKL